MPAGLDGNPNPIKTDERDAVLEEVGAAMELIGRERVLLAIDGAGGAAKSTFGDELARWLANRGHTVVRSTTDSFHRPRAERYQRGPTSGEGYYHDSHDLAAIRQELLEPFRAGAKRVQVTAFDEPADAPAASYTEVTTRQC